MSEKCKCGADAKYSLALGVEMALSDDTCAECHIVELNEGMQRLVDAVENYYVAAYEHEEELRAATALVAAQRRTIATLRARLRSKDALIAELIHYIDRIQWTDAEAKNIAALKARAGE